ncbi:hypothetical protein ABIB06_004072 [Bradyrhizobium sp. LB8.2]|uniref:T4SS efffector SepA family protein n=1 Tax=Bradyrhizobium sp. LB8.2 TaxID=3156330 RepID=UPI0033916E11
MPMITVSQQLFARIQRHAVPLVDDAESTLSKILDGYEKSLGSMPAPATASDEADSTVKIFPTDNPPLLTYTSLSNVLIDRKGFSKKFWNPVLFEMIRQAASKMGVANLKPHLDVNFQEGDHPAFGEYIKEANITVQGRDANLCYRSIMKIAKAAKIPVVIDFYWQDTPKAAHPNRTGRFDYDGK